MVQELIIAILTAFLPYASTIGSNLWGCHIVKRCEGSRAALLARDKDNLDLAVERSEKESPLPEKEKNLEIAAKLYMVTEENKNLFINQVTCGKTLLITITILCPVFLTLFLLYMSCGEDWQTLLLFFLVYFNLSMLLIGVWKRDRRVRTRLRAGLSEYICKIRAMNTDFLKATVGEIIRTGNQQVTPYLKTMLDKHEMEGESYWKDLIEHVIE